jgi:hypothetical protein
VCGQHDAGWLAFYAYFREACGLSQETQKLCGLWEIAHSANWWLPHQKICWVSERHNVLNRDGRGRLHCENGPALAYPDGWSIWALHGVRLPTEGEQIVLRPETQSLAQIDGEANAEIRRLRIQRYGWPRYLVAKNARVLDHRRNHVEGTQESLMQLGEQRVLVCVCPSTGKIFSMEVDPECMNCAQAQLYLSSGRSARILGSS